MDNDKYTEQQDLANYEQYLAQMMTLMTDPLLINILGSSVPNELVKRMDPVHGASFFAGLMLLPELQSNGFRLEALVHLTLGYGKGKQRLNKTIARRLFAALKDTYYQSSEDPAEDMMVTLVHHSTGSYRILEGLWESNAFHLQRFINIAEGMPNNDFYSPIKTALWSMLRVSDALMERAGLPKYCVGNRFPLSDLPSELIANVGAIKKRMKFTQAELRDIDVDPAFLEPFIYSLDKKSELLEVSFGSSPLERKPIVKSGGIFYVLLPSSLGIAIKHLIINFCRTTGMIEAMERSIKADYFQHFSKYTRLLGKLNNVPFQPFKDAAGRHCGAQALVGTDEGRYIQFILTFDDFKGYEKNWFNSSSPNGEDSGTAVQLQIQEAHAFASIRDGFREGLSIIIGCGWGRSMLQPIPGKEFENWFVEFLPAADITTFSLIPDMDPYTFWRLIKAKREISRSGVTIQNLNGLLNLYAWAKSNDFHLVPHEGVPEDTSPLDLRSFHMLIDQNLMLDVRHEVYSNWDRHIEKTPDGRNVIVQRLFGGCHFDEDKLKPIYGSVDDLLNGEFLCLIYGNSRKWWCKPIRYEGDNMDFVYRVWEGVCNWIYRLDRVIEPLIDLSFSGDINWQWKFKNTNHPNIIPDVPTYSDLINLTETKVEIADSNLIVTSTFGGDFILGFHQESNYAEKSMLISLMQGVLSVFIEEDKIEKFLESIVAKVFANKDGKSVHVFTAQSFRDRVKKSMPKPLFVNRFDDATFRIGLSWLIRDPSEGGVIKGIEPCTSYLRKLVDAIWLQMKSLLSIFNKKLTIKILLENHEALVADSERWTRTYRAALGLHDDKDNVRSVVSEQIALRDAGSTGSRLAIEMAICECNNEGGYQPGKMDVTKLITYATFLFYAGGWSDAIRYGMIPAKIQISPTGNFLFDHTFIDMVMTPYGQAFQGKMLISSAREYSKYFEEPQSVSSTAELFEDEFKNAWLTEYGFTIDEGRVILDLIENEGIRREKVVFELDESEFSDTGIAVGHSQKKLTSFLNSMVLEERESWPNAPAGFNRNDILPWRFKRRLSVVSRPIIKISNKLILAPGLIRDGMIYLLRNCHDASFEDSQFRNKAMRKWIGRKRNAAGHQFNKDVAAKFIANGWKAESDVLLTKLLNKNLDKDYGDIDVVAWNPEIGEVFMIECKDLEFAKTPGEVARQIYEFRGVIRENGKPDRLFKHLQRIRVLTENISLLEKKMKLDINLSLKPCLLFSNIVPLFYVNSDELKKVQILSFDNIGDICSQQYVALKNEHKRMSI